MARFWRLRTRSSSTARPASVEVSPGPSSSRGCARKALRRSNGDGYEQRRQGAHIQSEALKTIASQGMTALLVAMESFQPSATSRRGRDARPCRRAFGVPALRRAEAVLQVVGRRRLVVERGLTRPALPAAARRAARGRRPFAAAGDIVGIVADRDRRPFSARSAPAPSARRSRCGSPAAGSPGAGSGCPSPRRRSTGSWW